MKKNIWKSFVYSLMFVGVLFVSTFAFASETHAAKNMYRLYNPNSGEHFYTANVSERSNLIKHGWQPEGIGWVAPDTGANVYRLYNPNAGDHHYTMDIAERNMLIRVGWKDEGIGWKSGGSVPIYRSYNPNAKAGAIISQRI